MSLFLVVVIAVGWVFSQIYESPIILYFAVAFSLGMNFFSYWYSDKIVLKMSGAFPIEKKDSAELYRIVENLSITAGVKMPKIYIINDPAPNAFATGRNQERAVIAVTSGLLRALNKTELEGVIAHELSHIGNRDILISTVVVVLVGFIAMLSDFFLRFSFFGGRDRDNNKGNALFFIFGIVVALLAPVAAALIQMAISRKREFLADASCAMLTRYPDGLASALEKISQYPFAIKKASSATAHLYISNPFGAHSASSGQAKKISKLFMTHPPIEERVVALREMKV
ncbi:M48 family metallopeptidase [Patescibacteria group bacterium]|nr:M48 family metallopeptidase [Patescibacteria group bacterium]